MQKMPRHYAAEIIALPTKEQRRTALAAVPLVFQDWVAIYVKSHFGKQRCLKAYRIQQAKRRY